jgi:Arc/MetJ family transcription regulator
MAYSQRMRTNIDIDEKLVRKARKLTRQIVDKALELLVRSESRKGIPSTTEGHMERGF